MKEKTIFSWKTCNKAPRRLPSYKPLYALPLLSTHYFTDCHLDSDTQQPGKQNYGVQKHTHFTFSYNVRIPESANDIDLENF